MKQKKYIKSLFTRVLVSIILFLVTSIFINYSDKNLLFYKQNFYNKSFNFSYVNKLYNKYLGGILPFKNSYNDQMVMKSEANYSNNEEYENGVKIIDLEGENIKALKSGIVVYIGQKENFNETIIIQGSDGIDYWYGNLENINVTLYDYVEEDFILGNPKDGMLYLQFLQNGEYLDYKEFI